MKCDRCFAEVPEGVYICPKCGFILTAPISDESLRDTVKFNYITPIYTKSYPIYNVKGELVKIEVDFKLYLAYRDLKAPPMVIYDSDGYVNLRRDEYSLVKVDEKTLEKIVLNVPRKVLRKKILNVYDDVDIGENHPAEYLWKIGALVSPVPRLRSIEFLRSMDWRSFINNIINYRNVEMDERLKLVRLTHLMRGLKQSINPHALIVLPGQTGKSEWYKVVGICEDKVSANSLIGYADAEGPHPGSINYSELPFALDQIESSGMYLIFRYMLGLMEMGEARVDLATQPFNIYSTSVFAIISNPIGDPKSDFSILLEKLSRNPSLGRRFGIILYDKDAVKIKRREKDLGELRRMISIFRAIEEYAWSELKRIINDDEVWNWLNTRNEEWMERSLNAIESIKENNENLYLFLREFIENGWTHIRGGALRASLTMNLDKIALKEYSISEIISEAEEYLSDLLEINFNSIRILASTYQETREEGDWRFYDMLPTYMKEIVAAVELWRRNLKDEERGKISIPCKIFLEQLDYKPRSKKYFSQILDDARRGNPEKYNDELKERFKIEVKKEDGKLSAWIYDLNPITHLKVNDENDVFGIFSISEFSQTLRGHIFNQINGELNGESSSKTMGEVPGEKGFPKNFRKNGEMICGMCRWYGSRECKMENPHLITFTARYAENCDKFMWKIEARG